MSGIACQNPDQPNLMDRESGTERQLDGHIILAHIAPAIPDVPARGLKTNNLIAFGLNLLGFPS